MEQEQLFRTGAGSIWDLSKPIRTSMPISHDSAKGVGLLTGKFEDVPDGDGTIISLVEVEHDFGKDFIFESFISQ